MANARFSYRLTQEQYEQALAQRPTLELISIQQPSNGQWIVPASDIDQLNAETAARLVHFSGFVSMDRTVFEQAARIQHVADQVDPKTGEVVREAHQLLADATAAMYRDEFGLTGDWRYSKGGGTRLGGTSIIFEATTNLTQGTAPIATLRPVGKAEMAELADTGTGNSLPF